MNTIKLHCRSSCYNRTMLIWTAQPSSKCVMQLSIFIIPRFHFFSWRTHYLRTAWMNFLECPDETSTGFFLFELNLIHVGSFFLFHYLHFLLVELFQHINFSKTISRCHCLKEWYFDAKVVTTIDWESLRLLSCSIGWYGLLWGLEREIYRHLNLLGEQGNIH